MAEAEFVRHEPCDKCGSSDAKAVYDDGHSFCFSCNHYEANHEDGMEAVTKVTEINDKFIGGTCRGLSARKLTEEDCLKWHYETGVGYDNRPVHIANYYSSEGALVGQKVRTADKDFYVIGKLTGFYGQHKWKDGGKRVIITEGELDCISCSSVLSHRWPVVSLPNGAAGAKKAITNNIQWLSKFHEIVLCFDQDEPGRKAARECAALLPPGKVKIAVLPLKDASDMLQADKREELYRALWDAPSYRPDGIITVEDIWTKATEKPLLGKPWFISELNEKTYGRRYGEAVAVGAGTGVGKTTFITQQIAMDLQCEAVGLFALEQQPAETIKRVAGIIAKTPFHIPDLEYPEQKLLDAMSVIKNSAGLYLYDHFGVCDWETIKEHVRFLRYDKGVRLFYLDHITALVAQEEDERKALERIMSDIGSLVKELDIWLLFVSHLATPDGKPHEEGGRVMIRHFKGSRAIGFWCHFMFGLERNQQAKEDAEVTTLRVLKDRYSGRSTGLCVDLEYDHKTGLMKEAIGFEDGEEEGMF